MGVDNPEIWEAWAIAVEKARLKKDISSLKDGDIVPLDDNESPDSDNVKPYDYDIGIDNKRNLYKYYKGKWTPLNKKS